MAAETGLPYFYSRDGDHFVPTGLAASPWEHGKQNGVALGGLLAHLLEEVPSPAAMTTARMTIDILSAAPHAPTEGRSRIVREGKRIQLVETELVIEGRVVARAAALRTRLAETPPFPESSAYPPFETVPPSDFMGDRAFGGTLDTRLVAGALRTPGPGTLWVRFGHEHVQGVPLSPLVRAAALGDFGGGLGSVLDSTRWTYANLDIVVHLSRMPIGEWLLVDAFTTSGGNGVGMSNMILADTHGVFARAHQTLFVAPIG